MFVLTRISAPKRFAKFGWLTPTFCHKKVGNVIAKLESDRLYKADRVIILLLFCTDNKRCYCLDVTGSGGDFCR